MPLTHSLVFSFRAILKKSSDFYKVSQEILKSLIRFFKMAPITCVFIPGCHPNQATLGTLQELLAEAEIPCKIHSVERKESPYNDMFYQMKLGVSFDDTPRSQEIQKEIRTPSGMKVVFHLENEIKKFLVLKEYHESPSQDTPAPKRQPPPLMEDVREFPPISAKSSNPPQQQQQQQPQQLQQPQPQPQPQLQPQALLKLQRELLFQVHSSEWNKLMMYQQSERDRLQKKFAEELDEVAQFYAWKISQAETAQEKTTKGETVDFAEPVDTPQADE